MASWLLVMVGFLPDSLAKEALLPDGLVVEEDYQPGRGAAVGVTELVRGRVVIVHDASPTGYEAAQNVPLYQDDTLITLEKSNVRFSLNDGSVMTLGAETKLTLDRTLYDPENQRRSSFLNMAVGKARFLIKKLTGFRQSEFKVKTKTAIMGVRGSDFVVRASASATEVTALDDTRLEVISLAALDAPPALLGDFERTVVELGALPSAVEHVSRQEVEAMLRALFIIPGGVMIDRDIDLQRRSDRTPSSAADKDEGPPEKREPPAPAEEPASREAPPPAEQPEAMAKPSEAPPEADRGADQLRPEEAIEPPPDDMTPMDEFAPPEPAPDPFENPMREDPPPIDDIREEQGHILEGKHNADVREAFQAPRFPGTPRD